MIGYTLGHYRILEQIGAGGMGIVYRATDERLDRDVAIKILPEKRLADEGTRKRFRKEAIALSKLNHPNIATIHEFDTFGGVDFLVMEFIPGTTLSEKLASAPLPEPEVLRLGAQLAQGLAAAHAAGIVHRDLKPGNLRVTSDGRLKILDFGIAKLRDLETAQSTGTTQTDQQFVAGTLPYMAPEQLRGDQVDARCDIYAAGAVLYEMVTGRSPFADAHGPRLIDAILHESPVPPSSFSRRVSPALEAIILKALDKDPERRYQSARELLVDLERQSAPTPVIRARPSRRWRLRHTMELGGVVAALVAVWVGYRQSQEPPVFQERDWVLIADFDNRAGNPRLDQAVREGLLIALQQSRYVNVLPRDRVFEALKRMQRADLTRVDESVGLEICQRENIRVLLAGSIQQSGAAVHITVRGIRPATRALLFAESEQFAREEEIFSRVDVLARRVRERLGESVKGIETTSLPLAKVTTNSLEALQRYSQATDAMARRDLNSVLVFLQAALERDPNFAMAHRLLARAYEILGNRGKEIEHLTHAYAQKGAVTEREQYYISASYYTAQGHYEKAAASLRALVSLYPDDTEAHRDLAIAYRNAGDVTRAIAELRQVLRLDPFAPFAYDYLVLYLAKSNANEEAIELYNQARTRGLQTPVLYWGLGMSLLGQGKVDEAREQFHRMEGEGGLHRSLARLFLSGTAIYEGKLGAAAEDLDSTIRREQDLNNKPLEFLRRYLLGRIHLLRSQVGLAHRQAQLIATTDAPNALQAEDLRRAGLLFVRTGDLVSARRVLGKLEGLRRAVPSGLNKSCEYNLAAEIAFAEGNAGQAIESFAAGSAEYPRHVSHEGLARAYQAQRNWRRAAAEWEQVLNLRGEILQEGFPADWVLAHLELARVNRQLGDIPATKRHYAEFLHIWAEADDVPARREAAREWRQLVSAAAPGS